MLEPPKLENIDQKTYVQYERIFEVCQEEKRNNVSRETFWYTIDKLCKNELKMQKRGGTK